MANSILGGGAPAPMQNNPAQMVQQFQQFRSTFRGNPQQMVNQMLQSGRINQTQLEQAKQMAMQLRNFIK